MTENNDFLEVTLKLVSETKEKAADICRGADVKRRWYDKFIRRQIQNPGVLYVQRVHDYLKEKAISDSADG